MTRKASRVSSRRVEKKAEKREEQSELTPISSIKDLVKVDNSLLVLDLGDDLGNKEEREGQLVRRREGTKDEPTLTLIPSTPNPALTARTSLADLM